jgi:hypothetical protein
LTVTQLAADLERIAVETIQCRELATDAHALALITSRSVYDSMYVALAIRLETRLITRLGRVHRLPDRRGRVTGHRPKETPLRLHSKRRRRTAPRLPAETAVARYLLLRSPVDNGMTRFSRSRHEAPSDVERIAADLRRQREDLQRQKRSAGNSSSETSSILEKLEELRRRSEALANADAKDRA